MEQSSEIRKNQQIIDFKNADSQVALHNDVFRRY